MNSVADIWNTVLDRLSKQLSPTTLSTWFDETQAISMQDRTFSLYCPSAFKRSTIESLYMDTIKTELHDIFSSDFDVRFLSDSEFAALGKKEDARPASLLESGEYTFDNFVVGPTNNIAYAAARAVAEGSIEHYNPLFIYGDSGLGKTHLIYAIADYVRKNRPDAKIVYIKGDEFTIELVAAIREGKNVEFRNKYRNVDILLIDDIQFISGKTQTQEEFFHTFNTLYEARRNIVLTSDRPPKEMEKLEDRLRTRFEWGMLADVQAPGFETRLAIIKNKAAQWGTVIDDEIATIIAENVTSNVRQLEGMMNKILAYRDLLGKDKDEEAVKIAMKEYLENSNIAPTAAMIITEVSRYFSIDEAVVKGPSRNREAANARQIAMYLIRRMTNLSTPDIGRAFDGRDHATVIHSIKQVENKIESDPAFNQIIKDIEININSKR